MIGQLDAFNASVGGVRADHESVRVEAFDVAIGEAKVAEVEADERPGATDAFKLRAGNGGHESFFANEAAGKPFDNRVFGIWRALRVGCVSEPSATARELDDRVLEASAPAEEGLASSRSVATSHVTLLTSPTLS
jgi:hypothetical protein